MENRCLYKGKTKGNLTGHEELDWAVGNLIVEQSTGKNFIADLSHFDNSTKLCDVVIEVDPNTICRCTGLKDKNGKLIWENDIINAKGGAGVIAWDRSEWRIKWIKDTIWRKDLYYWSVETVFGIEVIGNKFDNPEMLEVQE